MLNNGCVTNITDYPVQQQVIQTSDLETFLLNLTTALAAASASPIARR
jgi:hypothetical protein